MAVHLGVLTVWIHLEGNRSLKGKRSVVRSILAKTRNRFACAAAETDLNDVHTRAELSFAVVSNHPLVARSLLEGILEFVDGRSAVLGVQVTDHSLDVDRWDYT